MIYGQSIEVSEWPGMFIRSLQDRYPHANIIGDNESIGGWNVGRYWRR